MPTASVTRARRWVEASTLGSAGTCRVVRRPSMRNPTDVSTLLLLLCCAAFNGCGGDPARTTQRAPGEGVQPAGGVASQAGSSSTSEPGGGEPSTLDSSAGRASSGAGGEPAGAFALGTELRIE